MLGKGPSAQAQVSGFLMFFFTTIVFSSGNLNIIFLCSNPSLGFYFSSIPLILDAADNTNSFPYLLRICNTLGMVLSSLYADPHEILAAAL